MDLSLICLRMFGSLAMVSDPVVFVMHHSIANYSLTFFSVFFGFILIEETKSACAAEIEAEPAIVCFFYLEVFGKLFHLNDSAKNAKNGREKT